MTMLRLGHLLRTQLRTRLSARADGSQRGASAVEYGLLITGIAAVIVGAVFLFGGGVASLFSDTCTTLRTARSGAATSC